ncbi:hypothetical protein AAFF_G00210130 [Aldrovandia affinis]|uniref:Ashwin n=1 Tax=Aldrovandia affinis TaxID=143900 RepID=A0AAD7SXI7_9TELE|nr:hypothetical protein AAFF_G00210130 [Aldrovandia affinis]
MLGPSQLKMADYNVGRGGKDTSTRNGVTSTDLLLHPELLSRDFIRLVLHEKNIEVDDHKEANRDQLTELYLQHVIPLPQRDLPNSRWGRRVGQTRPRPMPGHTHGYAHSSGHDNVRKRPLIVFDGSSRKTGTIKLKKPEGVSPFGATDRLKPPPSWNVASPIRKLSTPLSTPTPCPTPTPVSPPEGMPKSPTGNGRMGSPASPLTGGAAAAVKLKRQAAHEGECDSSGELKSPEVKKKIQHVTWP